MLDVQHILRACTKDVGRVIKRGGREINRVIEQELHKNAAVITKVSETASKEFAIESALDKMQGAWASVKLVIEEYRETGQFTQSSIYSLCIRTI